MPGDRLTGRRASPACTGRRTGVLRRLGPAAGAGGEPRGLTAPHDLTTVPELTFITPKIPGNNGPGSDGALSSRRGQRQALAARGQRLLRSRRCGASAIAGRAAAGGRRGRSAVCRRGGAADTQVRHAVRSNWAVSVDGPEVRLLTRLNKARERREGSPSTCCGSTSALDRPGRPPSSSIGRTDRARGRCAQGNSRVWQRDCTEGNSPSCPDCNSSALRSGRPIAQDGRGLGRNHPRAHGSYPRLSVRAVRLPESPAHAWVVPGRCSAGSRSWRVTRARVGRTRRRRRWPGPASSHPRTRGSYPL